MEYRTDRNNNPAAFTTAIAVQGGLVLHQDYEIGDPFQDISGRTFYTAKLIGEPVGLTIKVISNIGFYTTNGPRFPRWNYINIPKAVWLALSVEIQRDIIGFMYEQEGGVAMRDMFPNYGRL